MPTTKFLGSPYLQDPDLTIWNGDVREVLCELPDESVQMCVTSPPYFGLRDYGTEGQIGLEYSIDEFVDVMVGVFREVRRVLRPDGTLWLNLGDSYVSAPKGPGGDDKSTLSPSGVRYQRSQTVDQKRHDVAGVTAMRPPTSAGLKSKDLMMVPARVALALQADGWYLRSEITWCKPNPMPESVTDRPTQATEKVYLFSKAARYFYDATAVAEPADWERWGDQTVGGGSNPDGWIKPKSKQELTGESRPGGRGDTYSGFNGRYAADDPGSRRTRNLRNWWEIATEPYPEAHFATYPTELVRRCILAGSSERGCCPECGAPWVRETDTSYDAEGRTTNGPRSVERRHETAGFGQRLVKSTATTGWRPSCEHQKTALVQSAAACTILDPFFGSGTTGLVVRKLGRKCIGIELSPEYCALAAKRLSQLSLLAEGAA